MSVTREGWGRARPSPRPGSPTRSRAGIRPARRSHSPPQSSKGRSGASSRASGADLELGATTDAALAAFRERAASRRIDLLVAAIRLQRRSGGNLAALLRGVAAALEDQARLEADARTETAQARFTSTVVLAMPFCLIGLYEVVSPGTLGRITGSSLGVWLIGAAVAFQGMGAMLVRRLARVET